MNQIEDSDLSGDSEKIENLLRFSELREETHKTMQVSIDDRLRKNPVPSETELVLGAFTEELEPQVKMLF